MCPFSCYYMGLEHPLGKKRIKRIIFYWGNSVFVFLCITVFRDGPEYQEETTDLSQATNNTLSHNVASSTPRIERGSNSQH